MGTGSTLLAMVAFGSPWTGSLIGVEDKWALWAAVAGKSFNEVPSALAL
jgi:hypothetical protein